MVHCSEVSESDICVRVVVNTKPKDIHLAARKAMDTVLDCGTLMSESIC